MQQFTGWNPQPNKTPTKRTSSRSQWAHVLRRWSAALCWVYQFESRRGSGSLSVVSVVCCQVEVSATAWSLVQRSPNDCGVSECNREVSLMRSPWLTKACCALDQKRGILDWNIINEITKMWFTSCFLTSPKHQLITSLHLGSVTLFVDWHTR
jgi:hypothetical protein